jgi:hypothetical protein
MVKARRAASTFALLAAIACGDGGSGPTGSITATVSPTSLTLAQGGSGTVTVTLTRGGGFSEVVNLTVEGMPTGVTATVAPTQLTGTTTSAVVAVNVAGTVPAGTYPITVRASATGVGAATATYSLTVTAANFTISATPAALTIAAGTSGTSSIAIVRNSLTTDVALTLVNPPAGITGVFTPATLTGTTLTSSLALSVAGNVAAGTYPVTVQGAGGSLTRTTVVNVAVTAASVSLSMVPTTLSFQQGGSGQATLNATRTNFAGNITPSVTGNPLGMTVSFNPTFLTGSGTQSTVTVNVGGAVAVGNYTLTITGSTGGVAGTPTTTLSVSVTPGNNIVWEFCNDTDLPLKFWRLSGTTWTEVAPTVVGSVTRFSFFVSGTEAGVAFTVSNTGAMIRSARRSSTGKTSTVQRTPLRQLAHDIRKQALDVRARIASQDAGLTSPYFDTYVLLALSSELAGFRQTCTTPPAEVTKNFTLTGQSSMEEGLLGYGTASAALVSQTSSYSVMVPAGTYDYLAMWGPSPSFPSLSHAWSSYRIGRGEVAPGASVALNRTGATAFTQTPFTVTGGAGGSFYSFFQFIEGARGAITSYPIGELLNSSGNSTMSFLAPGDRLGTDMNALNILNTELVGNVTAARSSIRYFGSTPPTTTLFPLPQAVPAFTTSQVQGAPVTTWQVAGQTPTDYQGSTSVFTASFEGQNNFYTLQATRGWMAGNGMSTSYTLAGPILPDFLQAWAPSAPLVESGVTMAATNLTSPPVAGSVLHLAIRLVQSP